jgi:hypothetical protein
MAQKWWSKGEDMSGNTTPAKDSTTGSSTATSGAVAPTGYRVSIFSGALEVSARLASAEELQALVNLLQANMVIWANATKSDPKAST